MGMANASFILFSVIAVGAVILIWSLNLRFKRRELQHRERLAALEKGAPLPPIEKEHESAPWTPRVYLLRGMIWLFSGIAITLAVFAIAWTSRETSAADVRIFRATQARAAGATPEEVQLILHDPRPEHSGIPVGLALLGLIPVGVGLAYIIFYQVEGKKLVS